MDTLTLKKLFESVMLEAKPSLRSKFAYTEQNGSISYDNEDLQKMWLGFNLGAHCIYASITDTTNILKLLNQIK